MVLVLGYFPWFKNIFLRSASNSPAKVQAFDIQFVTIAPKLFKNYDLGYVFGFGLVWYSFWLNHGFSEVTIECISSSTCLLLPKMQL